MDGWLNKGLIIGPYVYNEQYTIKWGPLNLIIEFTTSTHRETLGFHDFESFQLIIIFIGALKKKKKKKKGKISFLGT